MLVSCVVRDTHSFIQLSIYQEVTPLQPLDELFCVVATYKLEGKVVQVAGPPFGTGAPFDGTVISAYNQGKIYI